MSLFACVAAILARRTGRAVKLRLDRDDDMRSTGKRHAFVHGYDVGYDDEGRILALDLTLASRCGFSALALRTGALVDVALPLRFA